MPIEQSTALETVRDYIEDARTLLQDRIQPYRYSTRSLLVAFNVALLEGRRIRPDLFVYTHHGTVPAVTVPSTDEIPLPTTQIDIEPQFRLAFVYGLCAHALTRDQEDVEDERSSMFRGVMSDMLIGLRPQPISTGRAPPSKGGT